MDKFLDKIAIIIVAQVVLLIVGLIFLIVSVAFFGPFLAPLMNKLPW